MKSLTLLLIPLILLSSCTIDWNDEKDTKIVELQKQVIELKEKNDDDLFKKKSECSGYSEKMLEYAKSFRDSIYEINEVFYSPQLKSCMFLADAGEYELLFDYLNRINLGISSDYS
jgi:hypothetical protein